MPKKKIDFETVRGIALGFPDVEVTTGRGSFGLKAGGKLFACPAIHKSAEPDTLMVRIGMDQRAELIAGDRDVYYVTDHYVNYPSVLVRLSQIDLISLKDLLGMSWRFATSKTKSSRRRVQKRGRTKGD
jgi:hypothetical protein